MKVSIIIPAYNVESYIEACLESVMSQTLKDIEVIIVNDGSTDGTCKKIEQFIHKDNRIRLIDQENLGPGEARNKALVKAQGEYIFFLDADDTLAIDACEKLYNQAKLKGADIIIGKMVWKNSEGHTDVIYNKYWFDNLCDLEKNYSDCINIVTGLPTVTARLIKREIIYINELKFPKFLGEDVAFWLFLWHKAQAIYLMNEIVYYRTCRKEENNKSITQTVSLRIIEDKLNILDICMIYCSEHKLGLLAEKILYNLRSIMSLVLYVDKQDKVKALEKIANFVEIHKISNLKRYKFLMLTQHEFNLLKKYEIQEKLDKKIKRRLKVENFLRSQYRKIKMKMKK